MRARSPMRLTYLIATVLVLSTTTACERDAVPAATDGATAADLASADLATPPDQTLPVPDLAGPWPRRVTLTSSFDDGNQSLRLADGAVLTTPADVTLGVKMVLSLRTAGPDLCGKGQYDTLESIPTDASCPASQGMMWVPGIVLGGSSIHTTDKSPAAGLSLLARAAGALYRIRVVNTSYQPGVATVTLDYAPTP